MSVTLEARGFEGRETFSQQLEADAANPGRYSVTIPGLVRVDNYQLTTTIEALAYSRVLTHPLQVHDLLALDVQANQEVTRLYTLVCRGAAWTNAADPHATAVAGSDLLCF